MLRDAATLEWTVWYGHILEWNLHFAKIARAAVGINLPADVSEKSLGPSAYELEQQILKPVLWSGRSGDVTMMLQAAIEITCHDHSTTVWVGRSYILLRYLVFVFVVRFLFIRWFPCIRHSIIFWGFPHVMVRVPLHHSLLFKIFFHTAHSVQFHGFPHCVGSLGLLCVTPQLHL